MSKESIWHQIELELRKAKKKHPGWPDHPAAQAGIVCEEAGELMHACLQFKYERDKKSYNDHLNDMRKEAIQTAVTAIRFLENVDKHRIITDNK